MICKWTFCIFVQNLIFILPDFQPMLIIQDLDRLRRRPGGSAPLAPEQSGFHDALLLQILGRAENENIFPIILTSSDRLLVIII